MISPSVDNIPTTVNTWFISHHVNAALQSVDLGFEEFERVVLAVLAREQRGAGGMHGTDPVV